MNFKSNKFFPFLTSLACLSLIGSSLEATCTYAYATTQGQYLTTISEINALTCAPPLSIGNNDIVLTADATSLTYVGTVGVEAYPNGGHYARTITGGGYSILSTVTSGTTINVDYGITLLNGSLSVGPGTLQLQGSNNWNSLSAITINSTGNLQFSGGGSVSATVNLNGSSQIIVDTGQTVTLASTASSSGTSLTKLGLGTLLLGGANTYDSGTTVSAGTFGLSGGGSLLSTGSLTLTGTSTFDISALTGSGTTIGDLTAASGNTIALGAKALTFGTSSSTTIAGAITGAGGSITKVGSGTATLSGANTFDGGATVSAGTLALSGGGSLLSTGALTLTGTSIFDISALTGSGTTIGALTAASGNTIALGAKALTFGTSSSTTIAGAITGAGGSITKVGSGTATLSGANTFDGGATVSAGTLALSGGGSLLSTGALTLTGTSIFDISALTGSGTTIGALTTGSGTSIALGDKILTIGTGYSAAIAGSVIGTGGTIVKEGTGSLSFSGDSSLDATVAVILAGISTFDISALTNDEITIGSLTTASGTTVNLGAKALIFGSTSDSVVAGTITGTGGSIVKEGACTVIFSGVNTYTGGTTINAGTLNVSADSALGASSGPLVLAGGTLQYGASFTLSTTRAISTTSSASGIDTNGFDVSISNVIFGEGGITKLGAGTLILGGVNSYTGATTISEGILILVDEGSISTSFLTIGADATLDVSGTSSATISTLSGEGNILLGNKALSIYQTDSTIFSGNISGTGSISIFGASLNLTGNNYSTGETIVENGAILAANGSLAGPVRVLNGGLLKGSGTVHNTVVVESGGTMSPGNSIGTITAENLVLDLGAIIEFEISPTDNSQIILTGALTVNGPAEVVIVPETGTYASNSSYTLMTYNSQIGGTSDLTVRSLYPLLLNPYLFVESNAMVLELTSFTPSSLVLPGNANGAAVAKAITTILTNNIQFPGSANFDEMLLGLFSLSQQEYNVALDEMEPALFKSVAITQQSNQVRVRESLTNRLQVELDQVHCYPITQFSCENEKRPLHIWGDAFGEKLDQNSLQFAGSHQVGYHASTEGVVLGIDYRFHNIFYAGALGAYTQSSVKWKEKQGKGNIDSGYGGLYFSILSDIFYVNTSVTGNWSSYDLKRNIIYTGVDVTAKNNHGGSGLISHIDTGINLGWGGFTVRPFDSFDYIVQREAAFKEKNAGVYNLSVSKTHASLLRNELGVNFASCICTANTKWTFAPKISWVREVRVGGSDYTAEFIGTRVPFSVTGYVPNRNILATGALLTGKMLKDRLLLSLYYSGEFAHNYSNNSYGGEVRVGF